MRIAIIFIFIMFLFSCTNASYLRMEAFDEEGDVILDGKLISYPDADLVYASILQKNNATIFIAKVKGEMKKSIYCEFNINNDWIVYYKGGKIFIYNKNSERGEDKNAKYSIKRNVLKIFLPRTFEIKNVTVRIDMKKGNSWCIDRITSEKWHIVEKRKSGTIELLAIFAVFIIALLKVYYKHR